MTSVDRSPGIVVGVDHSPAAAHAFEWAVSRADRFGPVQGVLAWSTPWWYDLTARAILPDDPSLEITDAAHELLDRLVSQVPADCVVEPAVVNGKPGEALVAATSAAELLVVGTRGHHAVVDQVIGSVSAASAGHSSVPVAVVPEDCPIESASASYVVGVDGSPGSAAALDWALAHARPDDAVIACQSWGIPVLSGYEAIAIDPDELAEATAASLRRSVEAACGRAGLPENRVQQRVEEGDPRTTLASLCVDGTVLVVGRRGRSRLASLVLGSVSASLIHRPPVVTVVVPDHTDE